MDIDIIRADYTNTAHALIIGSLVNAYAADPMGGGKALPEDVVGNLAAALSKLSYAMTIIGLVDGQPAGLVNCFEGFSTFQCKPLLNIHDMIVLENYRGLGLSQILLQAAEEIAIDKGCCKLTLEVLSNNIVAQASYRKFGFAGYELDPATGPALFWQKKLGSDLAS